MVPEVQIIPAQLPGSMSLVLSVIVESGMSFPVRDKKKMKEKKMRGQKTISKIIKKIKCSFFLVFFFFLVGFFFYSKYQAQEIQPSQIVGKDQLRLL